MKIYADENIGRSIGQCIRRVELIANILTDKDMENHIEFL